MKLNVRSKPKLTSFLKYRIKLLFMSKKMVSCSVSCLTEFTRSIFNETIVTHMIVSNKNTIPWRALNVAYIFDT